MLHAYCCLCYFVKALLPHTVSLAAYVSIVERIPLHVANQSHFLSFLGTQALKPISSKHWLLESLKPVSIRVIYCLSEFSDPLFYSFYLNKSTGLDDAQSCHVTRKINSPLNYEMRLQILCWFASIVLVRDRRHCSARIWLFICWKLLLSCWFQLKWNSLN